MTFEERFEALIVADQKIQERHQALAQQVELLTAAQLRTEEQLQRTDAKLQRAIRLGVRESRMERKRRAELDEKITQLAAAQIITEEKLQRVEAGLERVEASLERFLNAFRQGNGHGNRHEDDIP
jgi:sensor domain CHASE-containing protein